MTNVTTDGNKEGTENRAMLLSGLELVDALAELRSRRRAWVDEEVLASETAEWTARREAWWHQAQAQHEAGAWMPLVLLAQRLDLAAREVDALMVALAPQIDPEFLDRLDRTADVYAFRGIDADLIVGLLFHSPEDRFDGRELLEPNGKLVRNALVQLIPIGTELSPREVEVRPTDSLANYLLGRPLVSGPMAHFCELMQPLHKWDNVVIDADQKQLIWSLVSGDKPLEPRMAKWGYDDVFSSGKGLVILFAGPPGTGKTAFAHGIAQRLGRRVLRVNASRLMGATEGLENVLTEIFRIGQLSEALVLMDDCESLLRDRDARFLALLSALDDNDGLLVMTTNNASAIDFAMARRILYRLDFEPPNPLERELIWEVHLPARAPLSSDIDIRTLAATYEFTGGRIRNTVRIALSRAAADGADQLSMGHLTDAADTQLGARFDDLAVKSSAGIGLDRLVLPEREMAQLREVLAACRHREHVLNNWGFGKRLPTGRGLCVLFDGPPGTGKTFTAEILADELKIPLYRVHIPNVVSKWVGETERNIAEIFKRARAARAMLLFDEADSLFGRRSAGAQGANDRYANMEVNLLLQEIERYNGITVLTTNLYGNLDDALQRRIQFRVTFPMPEAAERANIWKILTPPEAPLDDDVDYARLGKKFELAGGHIKNAILRATYRACDDGDVIRHKHLNDAAIAECQAQGKIVRAKVYPNVS